jgi:hypothetical protein
MQIKDILESYKIKLEQKPQVKGARNRREEIINKFMDVLNSDRLSNGYPKLSAGFVVSKMARAGIKSEQDLYWFLRYCEDAKNFSSCWWWSLDGRNAK